SNSRSNGREQLYLGFGGLRVELNSGESRLGPSNFALSCCLRNFSLAGCKRMSALCSTLSERKLSLTFDVVRASGNDQPVHLRCEAPPPLIMPFEWSGEMWRA